MRKTKIYYLIVFLLLIIQIVVAQEIEVIQSKVLSGPDTVVSENSIMVGPDVTLAKDAAVVLAANKNVYFTGAVHIVKGAKLTLLNKKIATDVEELAIDLLPEEYQLDQNYPNPFNPSTTLEFSIPKSGMVSLCIYNSLGQQVAILVDEELVAGKYQFQWNAQNLASGTYYYRLVSDDYTSSKKMLLVK